MTARAATPDLLTLGVIGGSGLYDMEGLTEVRWVKVRTPFGDPSDAYCVGRLGDRRIIFLPRHGRGHRLTPTELNYRANIWGLKKLGATAVISVSAVGSMRDEIRPLDVVIPDQFYDHTKRRISTFFGEGLVGHVGMAHPVCGELGDLLETAARESGVRVHRGGTYICIEGPQFSTKGESEIYRRWGVSVIGMVLAAAGAVDHERLLAEAERLLAQLNSGTAPEPAPALYRGGVARNEKSFEQTHLVLAFEAPPYRHADYFAAQVCAGALGGGMENPERAVEILTWLKTFGASLALDDFGTGYCSLSYLHRFPCDTIKVDRSLVRDSGLNGSTPMILRSIVALSHELGKEVIAEGVETAEDAAYLRSIGCEFGQGFYYGEPMTTKEVADLLSALASHRKRQQRERSKAAARGHGGKGEG